MHRFTVHATGGYPANVTLKGYKMQTATQTPKTAQTAQTAQTAPVAAPNAFGAFVAAQQKQNAVAATASAKAVQASSMPATGTAVQQAAKAGFTRTVQNGRGNYTPNSIGALIWQTASALQAATPNTPVTSAAVRLALPHVKAASVSAGLSHWRKFNGTMRVKGVAPAPVAAPVAAVYKPAAPIAAKLAKPAGKDKGQRSTK